jgi:hypothetical protein
MTKPASLSEASVPVTQKQTAVVEMTVAKRRIALYAAIALTHPYHPTRFDYACFVRTSLPFAHPFCQRSANVH